MNNVILTNQHKYNHIRLLTFIEPAHHLWCVHLNFHDTKAPTTVRCSHLNEQYTHVEA